MTHANCPACYSPIEKDRLVGTRAYCQCGLSWDINGKIGTSDLQQNSGTRTIILFSVVLILSVYHYVTWDTFALQIIPLKIKQLTSMAKAQDYLSVAAICQARQKTDCQLKALLSAYHLNKNDLQSLSGAAEIYLKQNQFKAAAQLYQIYFSHKSALPIYRANYAQALVETGDLKGAEVQYQHVLATDKKAPNFSVARAYVGVLMKTSKLNAAKNVIEEYRKASTTSAMFLDKEWKLINAQMKSTTLTQSRLPASRTLKQ